MRTRSVPPTADANARDVLRLSGIEKSFAGVKALRGAALSCFAGEVHAVIGENGAGKSTLIKILAGAVRADAGEVYLGRDRLEIRSPSDAHRCGVATAFQELSLIPDLSVAANLCYGREPRRPTGRIDTRALARTARAAMVEWGVDYIDPTRTVRRLSLADRQVVEILKALMHDPRVLVLDEPTSALPPAQVTWLFEKARAVAAANRIVIFISHRLDEIRTLSDRVTVLRNGQNVGSGETKDMVQEHLVELMLGRAIEHDRVRARVSFDDRPVVCELTEVSSPPRLHAVSLSIREGEIVGVGGLQGQGQLELFLSLFGARRSKGEIKLGGSPVKLRSPTEALRLGIGLIPEDRAVEGLCLSLPVRDNFTLGNFGPVSRAGVLSTGRESAFVQGLIRAFSVALRTPRQEVSSLSGGNQQKVLLGRVVAREPRLLLMFDATRGVDVGTKEEIYKLMHRECERGAGILFYSSEISELVNLADRVVVLHDGQIRAHLKGAEIDERRILASALGG